MRKVLGILCLSSALGACTPYASSGNLLTGWMGGYSDSAGPGELTRVEFSGNGYVDPQKIGLYVMYRCAELAQQNGKPYFSMYPTIAHAIEDIPLKEAVVGSVGGKPIGTIYMLYQPSAVPGAVATPAMLAKYGPLVKGDKK